MTPEFKKLSRFFRDSGYETQASLAESMSSIAEQYRQKILGGTASVDETRFVQVVDELQRSLETVDWLRD